jgi:hypothetical protein
MTPGPATVRAYEPLDDLLHRMAARGVEQMIVTAPEGRLLGVAQPQCWDVTSTLSAAHRPDADRRSHEDSRASIMHWHATGSLVSCALFSRSPWRSRRR